MSSRVWWSKLTFWSLQLQDGISKELLSHLYTSSTIEDAARLLGVGVTALKKRCREVGIKRWPHRQVRTALKLFFFTHTKSNDQHVSQLQSLNNMIKGLQSMLSPSGDNECIKEAIQQIEQHVTSVVQDPSYEIPKNVFRLRQAQFKVRQTVLPPTFNLSILTYFSQYVSG